MLVGWRRGSWLDSILPPLTMLTSRFPFFFLALVLLYVLAFQLKLFPLNGAYTPGTAPQPTLDALKADINCA